MPPLDDDLQRTGARSTLMIDLSLDIDFQELIEEGAEPFAQRARAMLEEKLRALLVTPWDQIRNAMRPAPEMPVTVASPAASPASSAEDTSASQTPLSQ